MGNYCRRFAARGYTCFAIDYRLTPEGHVPSGEGYQADWIAPESLLPLLPQANHIRGTMDLPPLDFSIPEQEKAMVDGVISAAEDLRKAVLHIRGSAATYNIDPNRIVLGGFSAGAVTSWNVAHGMGAPVSGVFLLSGTDAGFDVNKAVTVSSDRPPILMFIGQYDLAGALSSVPLLIAHYEEVGVEHEFAWVPGFGHFYPAVGRRARMAGKFGVSMVDPPIRHARPQRQPDVDWKILSQHAALPPRSAMSPYCRMLLLGPMSDHPHCLEIIF